MRKFCVDWFLPLLVAAIVAFVLWLMFRDRIYVVGDDSMSPALQQGQKVCVEHDGALRRNDIVLVNNLAAQTDTDANPVFRRCFCMPGDSISKFNFRQLYGPAVVPRRGTQITLNYGNYMIYKDLAMKFEDADMQWRDSVCAVNGKVEDTYIFKRDYVFLVNDNRADLSDSRTFGPVPREWIAGIIKFVF